MDGYHHGHLRRAVLDRALEVVAAKGPSALSLRSLSAELGVSHTAPRHHFGSNRGLLTAIAAEGFWSLSRELVRVRESGAPFIEVGVAYVEFAVANPAYFSVMFQPTLLQVDDAEYVSASTAAFDEIRAGVRSLAGVTSDADAATAVVAAWSMMHGLATLELSGSLHRSEVRGMLGTDDISAVARRAGSMIGGSPTPTSVGGDRGAP